MSTDDTTRQRRETAKDLLLEDMDALIEKVLDDIVERVPFFAQLDDQQKVESGMIIRWAVTRGIERWVDNESMSEEDLEIVRSIAIARAQERRPMDASLRAWSSGPRSLIRAIQSNASLELTTEDVADLSLLTMDTIDRSADVFESAYTAAARRLTQDADGARSQLVRDILRGRPSSHAMFLERAERVGLVLPSQPTILTLVAGRSPLRAPLATELDALVADSPRRGPGVEPDQPADPGAVVLHVTQGDAAAVVSSRPRIEELASLATTRRWYGAVTPVLDWSACAAAYRQARSSIRAAPEWAFAERRILRESDIHVLEVLGGESDRQPQVVAREVLGELLTPEHAFLRDTLEVYLAHGTAPRGCRAPRHPRPDAALPAEADPRADRPRHPLGVGPVRAQVREHGGSLDPPMSSRRPPAVFPGADVP